ncbi:hypothetical protein PG996_000407 [Apiospora saccharicola]|uniref:Uncharacterized protein n=1 Tax=Apiospora saccharicola TaxID=335842 RepID=A0ABR1WDP4_9PEZI
MRTVTLASAALLAAHPILASGSNPVAVRADSSEDAYIQKVCNPPAPKGGFASGQPKGTSPLDLEAHAQCMCGGSYFSDYLGCQQCLVFHGARSERDNAHWASVLAVASSALCTGTPTASFQKIFESAGAAVYGPTTGATVSSDAKSGETAVSLYFSAKGSQGPGPITGSAAEATATAKDTATPEETGSSTTGGASKTASGGSGSETGAANTESGDSAATASSSTPTGNVAAPTGVAGAKGLLMAMAGGALVAAL